MQRITISLDDALLDFIDRFGEGRGYSSRSEAIRDILRETAAREEMQADASAPCVAALSYVYEHETRDLARRLTTAQHDHHDLTVATLHVHLDHAECLEVAVLKGPVAAVREFGDSMVTQRGVRLGHLHLVPVEGHAHPPHKPHK
ncbi:nickel-responsive transcriptional regulator NikR [Roseococcus sp. YIM B11640]|uniref:nickel-responsive transcriptional regulator NikR n=1 Tax=Roseococcus sp. YIM B11640 TaxID=3133973 RepID=UPI003C7BAF39